MLLRVGVWPCGDPAMFGDLGTGGRSEVGAIFHCDDEGLLRVDQAGLLDPGAVMPEAVGAICWDAMVAHFPADVALVDVGCNLVRPVHEVVIRVGALEEGMLIPVRIDGRLQGVLAVRCHHTRTLHLGGREDIGGELVHHVEDASTEELPDLLDGADFLADVVPGLDVQLVGSLGFASFGDHMVADPAHLGPGAEGLDAQALLVGLAVVYRDDPEFRLLAVIRIEVGHRLSLMVLIIGASDADSCSRLTVKRGGQCRVLRAPIEVVVLSRCALVAAAEVLPPPVW